MASRDSDDVPPPAADDICDNVITDPPPPYPDPSRPRRARLNPPRRRSNPHIRTISSVESQSDIEGHGSHSAGLSPSSGPPTEDDEDEDERRAMLLAHNAGLLRNPNAHHQTRLTRPRSSSQLSSLSAAPSLAHTVLSLFQVEPEEEEGGVYLPDEGFSEHHYVTHLDDDGDRASVHSTTTCGFNPFSLSSWRRYFRPMARSLYWRGLVHLLCVNFPFAVIAWVYCFVFTLVSPIALLHDCRRS
jgi:hypothetical protein